MKLQRQQKVRINCPNQRKWPAFHKAFHGKVGIVIIEYDSFVKLDISTEKISIPWINVDQTWLSHVERKT